MNIDDYVAELAEFGTEGMPQPADQALRLEAI